MHLVEFVQAANPLLCPFGIIETRAIRLEFQSCGDTDFRRWDSMKMYYTLMEENVMFCDRVEVDQEWEIREPIHANLRILGQPIRKLPEELKFFAGPPRNELF